MAENIAVFTMTAIENDDSNEQATAENVEEYPELRAILPPTGENHRTRKYRVVSYTVLPEGGFRSIIRTDCNDKESALKWVENFQEKSLETYTVDKTYEEDTIKVKFKKIYHCHQNTRPGLHVKTPHAKHVNCPAKLTITVRETSMKKSKDPYLKDYPMVINMLHNHNHPIAEAEILRYRRPSAAVREEFLEMFRNGHTPLSALHTFKYNLQEKLGDKYYSVVADRAQCPTEQWCYALYYKTYPKDGRVEGEKVDVVREKVKRKLDSFVCRLKDCMDSKPEAYVPAVKKFLARAEKLADSELQLALGAFTDTQSPGGKKKPYETYVDIKPATVDCPPTATGTSFQIVQRTYEPYQTHEHSYVKRLQHLQNVAQEQPHCFSCVVGDDTTLGEDTVIDEKPLVFYIVPDEG